ncbi:DEAD/DEAH box helicase [Clostridiisalibacter paucivorans]|uniref:DEAD/DEAH box helicase n=1 Tax=Clostridiisalibacter paucivorans TaxID=408753 RepID=UPI0004792ED6|nr:DEAD/DEAH box helicase family protein [Clostridiisalibacter paucivorans]
MSYFKETVPYIEGNKKLRDPQVQSYIKIKEYFEENDKGEALVVLPTGTGKSGLISIAPYGVCDKRVLVITPGLVTKKSVIKTLHPLEDNFWLEYDVLFDPQDLPVVVEYEPDMLKSSLENSHFVIANVHKLYKNSENSLLKAVEPDFFDLIIVDEAHHSIADTWQDALKYFKDAKKLHLTGTPYRGDGREIPGEEIHKTSLSEVMASKYVKWLRKVTVKNSQMYFTIQGDDKKYSKDEIIKIKDKEWLEKSVALSEECSNEVIQESIVKLDDLRRLSPDVNHKILAVACSIKHAEDIARWYRSKGKKVTIVHSKLEKKQLDENMLKVERHECDVVVSVNMLMEGYDHKYLSILAIFRPYRSKNAFAQVVGRVLRVIPEKEITDFAIDNNAFVIYHEDTGLDKMWEFFRKEIERSKKVKIIRDYTFSEREYEERNTIYGDVEADEYYLGSTESYLNDIDFNQMFEDARNKIELEVDEKLKSSGLLENGLNDKDIEDIKAILKRKAYGEEKEKIDELLIEKRPELARKKIRESLVKDANEAAQLILEKKGIDPKSNSLYFKFKRILPRLTRKTNNDGILVWYINSRVRRRYGTVNEREPQQLLNSQRYMTQIVEELERMI